MHFHVFDIIAAAGALIFVILGFKRGFVEEIIRLVGIVAAFFLGLGFYRKLAALLTFVKLPGSVVAVISFLLIFIVALLLILLLSIVIKKIVHLTVLGWVDRICGGVLGFIKMFFIVWVVVIVVASLPLDGMKNWFKTAKTYSFFSTISPALKLHGLLPENGPVQNILNANPLPALINAYHKVAPAIDSKKTSEHEHAKSK